MRLVRRQIPRLLFRGVGLPCQQRFIDKEIFGFSKPAVSRYQIAGGKYHDVARYNLDGSHIANRAIAQHGYPQRHTLAQLVSSDLGAMFLNEIQYHGWQYDCRNNDKALRIVRRC